MPDCRIGSDPRAAVPGRSPIRLPSPSGFHPARLLAALLALWSCAPESAGSRSELIVATTTSVEDSGLMEWLAGPFAEAHPELRLRVVALGSGEALAMGRRGDADVLLTHAPEAEARFVGDGHGERSTPVMYNHFVIVGPPDDPAKLRAAISINEALRRVATRGVTFLTRGDSSGTHVKELSLWRAAAIAPPDPGTSDWYVEAGLGMGDLLRLAAERRAYTLADEATFLTNVTGDDIVVLYSGDDAELRNPYSVTVVAGARELEGARAFHDWLAGPDGQRAVEAFAAADRFATPPFTPLTRF